MTFQSQEQSVDQSNPIELFSFAGTIRNFYYTSGSENVNYLGNDYLAISLQCSDLVISDATEKNELKISLPTLNELVQMYGIDIPPPDLSLTIYRLHYDTGLAQTWFSGEVTDITLEGETTTLTVPSIISVTLASDFPGAFYQGPCGRILYDNRCTVSRALFSVAGTVAAKNSKLTYFIDALNAKPDQWAKGGELVSGSERRLIRDQIGPQVVVSYPFRDLKVGDSVTVFAGCDRSASTCKDKFSNLINFFGFPYTPSLNPFLKQPEDYKDEDGDKTDVSGSGGGSTYVLPVLSSEFPAANLTYNISIGGLTDLAPAGQILSVQSDGTVTNNPTSYVTPAGGSRWLEVNQIVQTRLRKLKGFGIPWPSGVGFFASPNTAGVWTAILAGTDMSAAGGGVVAVVQDDNSFVRTARVQTRAAT